MDVTLVLLELYFQFSTNWLFVPLRYFSYHTFTLHCYTLLMRFFPDTAWNLLPANIAQQTINQAKPILLSTLARNEYDLFFPIKHYWNWWFCCCYCCAMLVSLPCRDNRVCRYAILLSAGPTGSFRLPTEVCVQNGITSQHNTFQKEFVRNKLFRKRKSSHLF